MSTSLILKAPHPPGTSSTVMAASPTSSGSFSGLAWLISETPMSWSTTPRGFRTPSASHLLTQAADPHHQPCRPWDSQGRPKTTPGGNTRQPHVCWLSDLQRKKQPPTLLCPWGQSGTSTGRRRAHPKPPHAPKPQPDGLQFSV